MGGGGGGVQMSLGKRTDVVEPNLHWVCIFVL